MPSVYRVGVTWNGFQGSPGYTRFSWQELTSDTNRNAAGAAVRQFFFALAAHFSTGWTISVDSEIQEFDMGTGQLLGAVAMPTVPSPVTGTTPPSAFAGGSGYSVSWRTGEIFNGRRVQGRSFIVPAIGVFETNGTLTSSAIATATAAGNALIASGINGFSIWAKLMTKDSPPVQIGGALYAVGSCIVKDAASQLRTRRN